MSLPTDVADLPSEEQRRLCIVSQSSLGDWDVCPRMWAAKRIEKLPDTGYAAQIGTACHRAVEAVTIAALEHPDRDSALVARDALLIAMKEIPLSTAQYHEALQIMELVTSGRVGVNLRPWEGWTIYPEQEILLNDEFEVTTAPDEVAYTMRLDRLSIHEERGVVEVSDFKTSHDYMSEEDIATDLQALVYSMGALRAVDGAEEVIYRRVMLRLGYTARHPFVAGQSWERTIIDRLRVGRERITQAVTKTREFPEVVGSHCRYCPRRGVCGSLQGVIASGGMLVGLTDPVEKARALRALKAVVSELDAWARVEAEANGAIPLSETKALGFKQNNKGVLAVDEATALQKLRDLGMTAEMEAEHFRLHGDRIVSPAKEVIGILVEQKRIKPKDKKAVILSIVGEARQSEFTEFAT